MNVAIVGFGIEGRSAYDHWSRLGAAITVCDQNPEIAVPSGAERQLGEGYLKGLERFDVIVRSAGINPAIILSENPGTQDKITTVVDEFLRISPAQNVIGVTGTKGKGTTSTLIAKMLKAAGEDVHLGGNIGLPPLELLPELTARSWVVLELSSFQLIDIRHSPHIAVCLMVVPEHLNWHINIDDYTNAKSNLFKYQTPNDIAIYSAENKPSQNIVAVSHGKKVPYFADPGANVDQGAITIGGQRVCQIEELKLLGRHNWQNACAAVTAVWQVTQNIKAMRSVLTSFSGLEHRLEFVREVDGIQYYDDSFGTTPETAIVAIQAFDQPKVVILGGSDKGTPFDELAQVVSASNVRQVILIGNGEHPTYKTAAPDIEAALRAHSFTAITPGGKTMDEIVQTAHTAAKPGDVILLSPACASFDMFNDYKDRGDQFKQVVNAL